MSENAAAPSLGVDPDGTSLDIITVSKTLLENFDLPANRVCMVCFDSAEYPTNPLICCSIASCRMRVHVACYGSGTDSKPLVSYKKRSKWVCDVCTLEQQSNSLKPNADRACTVCKIGGGVLKPTKTPDEVCHLVCVRWLPELKQVPSEMHPASYVVDAELLNGMRKSLKCHICQKRNGCLQCMSKRCTKAFHTVCALRALESKVYTGTTETNQLACFCESHFADVRGTYRSIKDVFWNQPYLGEEVDDDEDDEPEEPTPAPQSSTQAAGPSSVPSTVTPLSIPPVSVPQMNIPVIPFSKPPTPNKIGRPKKNTPVTDPSLPKPTLPPPPGIHQNPSVMPSPFAASQSAPPQMAGYAPQPLRPPTQPDVIVCQGCLQPTLRSMLQAHLSVCPGKSAVAPKDMMKKPRGRPPGSTNKPKELNNNGKKQGSVAPSPRPVSGTNMTGVTMPSAPRPMMMHPRPQSLGVPGPRPTPMQVPHSPPVIKDILMENAMDVLRSHAVDPLFSTWPGMLGGGLMQSRDFWTQVVQAFFSKPGLSPPKWNPLTQWLAGIATTEFLQPLKAPAKCTDSVSFTEVTDSWLSEKTVEHTCDAMLQAHGLRCIQLLKPYTHIKSMEKIDNGDVVEVVMRSHGHKRSLKCRFAVVCSDHAPTDKTSNLPGVVWSRFRPSKDYKLPHDSSLPSSPVWVALLSSDEVEIDISNDTSVQMTESPINDDVALEMVLCVDVLQEQMKVNRMRWRNLWLKAQKVSNSDTAIAAQARVVESLYQEYNWWKSICVNLIKGTNDMPFQVDDDGNVLDTLQPFEEGTCVVCMDGTSEDANPIIFCDRCDLAVHQRCYGVATIPKSDFFCDRCVANEPVQCALCPHPGGALKKTVEGKWIHLVCAMWCPTTFLVKVPRMLFQLSPDDSKVRFASPDIETSTRSIVEVAGMPSPVERGGLCRICRVATGCTVKCSDCPASFHPLCAWFEGYYLRVEEAACGFVCAGGGKGLKFKLTCMEHVPANLPCKDRQLQRNIRQHLYKIDSRERCGVCFQKMSPVFPQHKLDALPATHYFIRCISCHVQCHANCVHPTCSTDPNEPSVWKCEKCRFLMPPTKPNIISCLLCDQSQGYMIPVHAISPPVPTADSMAPSTLIPVAPTTATPHVHLYCATAFRLPIQKSNRGRSAQLAAWDPPTSKCALCNKRTGQLVSCWKKYCSVSFHPFCAAKAMWFSYKNKSKVIYCCSSHPPDFAAFDAENQVWITQETLIALQEIRCSLERVRMFIDLSKQREKIKKRLFVNSDSRAFEKAMEFAHVIHPTETMKRFYKLVTGDEMPVVAKRKPKPLSQDTPRKVQKTVPGRRPSTSRDSRRSGHHISGDTSKEDEQVGDEDDADRTKRVEALWSAPIPKNEPDMEDIMADVFPDFCKSE
ncbi:hypothetical protein Ae201684_008803 [Aphanomyces euteiches]|uniref:PHD-type domain-containing protein n=1 Tax=Aphanomyces euteiches TaxID=100861 RepID=A0A6G0X3X1_9STRA|nr:hypothetical protein Ae201684_008803 [Aphanomyces euteiches]KAH9157495.1 hypothetical protein AeRB84_000652 [Aphanomyces euteiches]